MRNDAHRYLIAYDVPHDGRRARLAKTLEGYGDRIQYSVFVVDAARAKFVRLRDEVKGVIDTETDSVLVCDLGPLSSLDESIFSVIGADRPLTEEDLLIV